MFKLCVFDMDGTLVDSIGDIAAAMNRSLEKLGYKTYPVSEYKHMVGDGMEVLCRRAIQGESEERIQKLTTLYEKDYLKNCCTHSKLYPGMGELIKTLSKNGIKCAVLSNKPHEQVMEIAKKIMDCDDYFKIMGQSDRFPTKPAPDSLLYIIKESGVERSEVAYIGDSNVDIRLGKAAKVFTVGAAWGFRGEDELVSEGASVIAHDSEELKKILM